jgi:hypothetical protein
MKSRDPRQQGQVAGGGIGLGGEFCGDEEKEQVVAGERRPVRAEEGCDKIGGRKFFCRREPFQRPEGFVTQLDLFHAGNLRPFPGAGKFARGTFL